MRGSAPDGLGGGDPGRGLRGQIEVELTHEQLLIGAQFGVAGQDQGAPVRGREADVQHLDRGERVEHGTGCQPARQRPGRNASEA